ncbi:uncharacterized protein LOC106765899 [Vigna radiata var. radiata]|uniref:Uncharacterized protein LOC106765899 n=1 Tax=Vigna radiata var. radiata TaxID=3916 RepID=A0A1S3UJE8_VIGRR|nr:uncharacterized protein LOC106765899 [Vigna radiata var. radiata]
MAGEVPLEILQNLQQQIQEMRAEIATMRAEQANRVGGHSDRSVNVETYHSDTGERPPTEGEGRQEHHNPVPSEGVGGVNGRGAGRGDGRPVSRAGSRSGGRGRGRGNGRGDPHRREERQRNEEQNPAYGDQAEGLHPFTPRVMQAIIPENKVLPSMERYGGSSDPIKHLRSFVDAMAVYSSDELVWCRVFSLSLKEEALDWFHSLQPGTIDNFVELRQLFTQQYASSKTPGVTYMALVRMKQGREESLKLFMDRFNRTARQVQNADQRLVVSALTTALRPGPFCDYLHTEEPQSMDELQNKLASFIRIEEGRAHQRGREEGESMPRPARVRSGPQSGGNDRRGGYRGKEHNQMQVLEEALRADLLTVVQIPTPRGADESKYCRYHQNRGHTTEDCHTLKDKLESLVQAGHLQKFVHRGIAPTRPDRTSLQPESRKKTRPRIDRSRSRSTDRTVRGVINTISGGFAGGGSTSAARKRHLRNLHSSHRTDTSKRAMPTITFSDNDFHAPDLEQDDPMVITAMIARYRVSKVLIDQGSSANILYWKTFKQMDISEDAILPFNEQIVGFAGERVDTRGYVDLRTSLGADRDAKEMTVRFLLVEADTSYNVLLGRPCLNMFGAIVSTPHLTLKYPTDDGKVATVRADQKMARECYAAGLKVKPRSITFSGHRSEVAMMELDPRTQFDDRVEPLGDTRPVVIGQQEDQCTTIGRNLTTDQVTLIEELLLKNRDLFAWQAADMPGIHPDIISHKLSLFKDARPVAQRKRRLGNEKRRAVEEEVTKLLEAGFIREVKYTTWLSNVVMVKKPSGKWRMCTDFTDLNKACPKDTYPLPSIDGLVDGVSGYEILSFLDAYSGYNQIPMYQPDRDKTAFITERSNYCYEVMPFGLKNAGATYQRLMDKVFQRQIGRCMEVYVDDMVVRSRSVEEHLRDLAEVLDQVRKFGMRLNPLKCTFGVSAGKFLGFMLTSRGIEANPDKCRAILEMRSPSSLKEVQRLVGRLTSLSRFIPKLADRIQPILKLMKKQKQVEWNDRCEAAFDEVKQILSNPPVMRRPDYGCDLHLFLAVGEEAVSAALVQEVPEFRPVYFISRVLKEPETRYQQLEKIVLALVIATRRLRPYLQGNQVIVRTDYPISKILRKLDLAGRMIGWFIELSEFGLRYEPRGSIKGQHLADFVAELPGRSSHCYSWVLYVDGSSSLKGGGAGVVLEGPDGIVVEQALIFRFKASNNQAESEALIAGLELARDLGVKVLCCKMDSQLVAGHMNGTFQIKDDQLLKYFHRAKQLFAHFDSIEVNHIPRSENQRADRLSKLSTGKEKGQLSSLVRQIIFKPAVECLQVYSTAERDDWRREIVRLIQQQEAGTTLRTEESKQVARYVMVGEELYRRGYVTPMLKCVSKDESEYVMQELHEGICGRHGGGRSLRARALRAGFYWPTMEKDCQAFVVKCLACQKHGNIIHTQAAALSAIVSPWPYAQWGMDIVGSFPTGRSQFKFLLVAIDYFTKWVEAEPLAKISASQVQKFVWRLICRFGLPKHIITDNGR